MSAKETVELRAGSVSARALASAAGGLALLSLVPVLLRQLGVIRHLPDPPLGLFNSDEITGSKGAYPMHVPDSLLGMGSYGVSLALIARPAPPLWWRRVTRAKVLGDAGLAAFNSVRQVVVFRRVCSWCLVTAAATAVMTAASLRALEVSAKDFDGRALRSEGRGRIE